jgi:hypothetical protein
MNGLSGYGIMGLWDYGFMQSEHQQGVSTPLISIRSALRLGGVTALRMAWPPSGSGKTLRPFGRVHLSSKFTQNKI